MGARHDDLRALVRLADLDDVRLQPRALLITLVGDLLGLGQQRLDAAEVEQGVAVVALLHDAGDETALAARVLLVFHLPLDFTDALLDDLLGRLCGDAAEVLRRVVPLPHDIAVLVELLRVDPYLARVGVDGDDCFFGGTGLALVGGDERVRQRVQELLLRHPALALYDLERFHEVLLEQFHRVPPGR